MSNPLPFFKFFPRDWQSDDALRSCGLAARGLWVELLCMMWKAERRGYLEIAQGLPYDNAQISRITGESVESIEKLIGELERAGVFSREPESRVIFSRRIVKEADFFARCSAAGKKGGGNPALRTGNVPGELIPLKAPLKVDPKVGLKGGIKPQKVRRSDVQNTPVVPLEGTKGPLQLRAEKLMHRRPETPLTVAEDRAFKKNKAAIVATAEEDWLALEAYYAAPQDETFSRKDLAALINNWNGEIDRARKWAIPKSQPKGHEPPRLTVHA